MAEPNIFWMISGNLLNICGTNTTPRPIPRDMAMISMPLRLITLEAMILIPAAATVPNIIMVAPPSTELGIMLKIPPMTGKTPTITKNSAIK